MEENRELEKEALPECELTAAYVLQQIEIIRREMVNLNDELQQLARALSQTDGSEDSTEMVAEAFRDAVVARETTSQQLLTFYKNVYEDVRPRNVGDEKRRFIIDLIKSLPVSPGAECPDYGAIIHAVSGVQLD